MGGICIRWCDTGEEGGKYRGRVGPEVNRRNHGCAHSAGGTPGGGAQGGPAGGMEGGEGAVGWRAARDVRGGSVGWWTYGSRSNEALWLWYGFVPTPPSHAGCAVAFTLPESSLRGGLASVAKDDSEEATAACNISRGARCRLRVRQRQTYL